jgi:uncharacterized membrane protein YbaN (DUF454 family)
VTNPGSRKPARRSKTRNLVLAVFFFIVGVIGILVPVMPQILFFAMSALFLSLAFPRVRRVIRRFRQRHPKLDASYTKWRANSRRKRLEKIRKRRA